MLRRVAQQDPDKLTRPIAIAQGGTGAKTSAAALQALGGVSNTAIAQPLGPVPLNTNDKIPLNFLPPIQPDSIESIYGPNQAFCSVLTKYWLSDFDIGTTYTVTCADGTVSIVGNEIHYTPPATPGNYGFSVNGHFFTVSTISSYIDPPTFQHQIYARNVYLTLDSISTHGNTGQLFETDWEISTVNTFASTIATSSHIPTDKNVFWWQAITPGITVYARARVHTQLGFTSEWSAPVALVVPDIFYPFVQIQAIPEGYGQLSPYFSALDYSGQTLFIGSPYSYSGLGAGVVFPVSIVGQNLSVHGGNTRSDGSFNGAKIAISSDGKKLCSLGYGDGVIVNWVYDNNLTMLAGSHITPENESYGINSDIDITGDGTRVIAGNPSAAPIKLAVYLGVQPPQANFFNWSKEADLIPLDGNVSFEFGWSVAISKDGTRAIVGARLATNGTATRTGAAYIFKRTGSAWVQEAKILPTNPAIAFDVAGFGSSVDIDASGTRVVIGAQFANSWSVYVRNGTTWSMETESGFIGMGDTTLNTGSVVMSDNGDKIAVAYPEYATAGIAGAGMVGFYISQNNVWNNVKNFSRLSPQVNDLYGRDLSMSGDGNTMVISFGGDYSTANPIPVEVCV